MSKRHVTPITLVMAYYENPNMLQWHWDEFAKMDPALLEHIRVVIVDDGSPTHRARPPAFEVRSTLPLIQIYRMIKDIRWNQDACRNAGVAHAETDWVLLTDMDHMVEQITWAYLVNRQWDTGTAYKFARVSAPAMQSYKPHPNSWFMTRKLFDAVGGYDERFAGLYGTDGDFRDRVYASAREVIQLKQSIVRIPREVMPDASTTTYLRKQPEDRVGLALVYAEREGVEDWKPLRESQNYIRVFP